jgi:hypothetical protein
MRVCEWDAQMSEWIGVIRPVYPGIGDVGDLGNGDSFPELDHCQITRI